MATVPDARPQPDVLLRYNNGAVAIHWITVVLLLTQVYVGFTFQDVPRPARGEWFDWHKTLGVTILLLSLVRLAWRLAHKPPPYPPELSRWERLAATWNHRAFYVVLIALPLTGLAAISGGADTATTTLVGGIPFPLIPGLSEDFGDEMGDLHEMLVTITFALIALHVAGALKHQFLDRTRAAGRMPPLRAPRGTTVTPVD